MKNLFIQKGILVVLTLVTGAVATSGCVRKNLQDGQASTEACGPIGFRKAVYPILRENCVTCHSGAGPGIGFIASSDPNTAYASAVSRITIPTPANSLLVKRASETGHGSGCTTCGPSFGDQLGIAINAWAQGELGIAAYCTKGQSTLDACTKKFVDYFDPNSGRDQTMDVSQVAVVPAGLAYFRDNMLNPRMSIDCVSCHVPSAIKAPLIPFADNSSEAAILLAYKTAKARMMFSNLPSSLLVAKPSNVNHGEGCIACGNNYKYYDANTGLTTSWANLLAGWAAAEGSSTSNRVELSTKLMPTLAQFASGTSRTLTWNLDTDLASGSRPELAGVKFSVTLRLHNAVTDAVPYYTLTAPSLTVPAAFGAYVHLEKIGVVTGIVPAAGDPTIPPAEIPTASSFFAVEQYATPLAAPTVLSSALQILAVTDPTKTETDKLGFSFYVLEKTGTAPPPVVVVDESKGLTGLCTGKNLELFVKNVYMPNTTGLTSTQWPVGMTTHCAKCHSPSAVQGGHPVVNFDSVGIVSACLAAFAANRVDINNPANSLLLSNPQGKNQYESICYTQDNCIPPFAPYKNLPNVGANVGIVVDPASPYHPVIFKNAAQMQPWMEWIQDSISQASCK